LNDCRNCRERVFENRVDIVLGKPGHRIARNDDLIAPVDRVEGEILNTHVHRNADSDERVDPEIPKNGIELGTVERRESVKSRKHDVALIDGNFRYDFRGFASGKERVLDPSHMLKEARIGIGAASVGSAFCDAVEDANASLASNADEFGNGLDHSTLRTVGERWKAREIPYHTALAFEYDECALFGRKQPFDSFCHAHSFGFAVFDAGRLDPAART
jgi:hypothetical protein